MTNATQTTDTNAVPADAATTPAAAPAAPKAPSKKSQALAIFQAKMADRAAGKFASNKEFRAAVLTTIQAELGVSVASAATMYNSAKKDAEAADATVKLGRDPKKEKAPSTGKRGRPVGSKNKPKEVSTGDAVTTTETPAAEPVARTEVVLPVETPATEVAAPAADAVPA